MSLTIKICMNTIILSNKAFSTLKETYLSFRDYPNLRYRCPLNTLFFQSALCCQSAVETKSQNQGQSGTRQGQSGTRQGQIGTGWGQIGTEEGQLEIAEGVVKDARNVFS